MSICISSKMKPKERRKRETSIEVCKLTCIVHILCTSNFWQMSFTLHYCHSVFTIADMNYKIILIHYTFNKVQTFDPQNPYVVYTYFKFIYTWKSLLWFYFLQWNISFEILQELRSDSHKKKFDILTMPVIGKSLVTLVNWNQGDRVLIYEGETITADESKEREEQYKREGRQSFILEVL